jgi:type I restriction enzyme S subunit
LQIIKKSMLENCFPKNGEKVPKIRFSGFTGDWEQRKLSDLVDVCSGMDYKHLSIGNIPVFGTGGYMLSVDKALSYDRDAIGIGRKGTIDKPYILKAPFWTVDTLFYCIPRDEGTLNFDYDLFQCIDWKQKDESTGVPSLSKVAINDTDVMVPKTDEQKKIGYFFEKLDLVITLHQSKAESWKNKKNQLSTIYWEQRKLSDVANVYDGVHQTPDYQKSGVMFLSVENIATLTSDKYITQEAFERDYKNYPEKGDILMTRIGDVGTPNVVETVEKVAFYVSLALLKPKNADSYFLCNAICSPEFQRGLKNRTLVTAIPQKINKDEIGKVEFLMPQNTAEQKAIGAYFKNLDHLITLHHRKLNRTQICINRSFLYGSF